MIASDLLRYTSFLASIKKIDSFLCHDTYRWCLGLPPAGRDKCADYKPGKYEHYANAITSGQAIAMPEFFMGGNVDIMDGRHRIYAMNDAGFSEVIVTCKESDVLALKQLIGSGK